jgi:hypothetical protein
MLLRAAVAVVLFLSLAPSDAEACTGKLSGALSGTFGCTLSVTAGKAGQFSVVIAPSGKIAGIERFLPATFELPGKPAVGTFTLATFAGARASLQTTGKVDYVAGLAAGKRQGEVTLVVETAEREARGGYTLSGTLRARLVPASGTGAPVVMDVAF